MKWLFMRHAPLIIQPMPDPAKMEWVTRMLSNCTSAAYGRNKSRMVRLAEYSRDCLMQLRADTGISYDERTQGTLATVPHAKAGGWCGQGHQGAGRGRRGLRSAGRRWLHRGRAGACRQRDKIAGGLRLPGDETGDCFKFTNALEAMAKAAGVVFHYGVDDRRLETAGGKVAAVATCMGPRHGGCLCGGLGQLFARCWSSRWG